MSIEKIKFKSREKRVLKDCGCACRCPSCGDILNDQAECKEVDESVYSYKCGCGHKSEWLFDGPVPMVVK